MSVIRDRTIDKICGHLGGAFTKGSRVNMANDILTIPELAIVERGARLPTLAIEWNKLPFVSGLIANNMKQAINEVIALKVKELFKAGWVKEVKE